MVAINGVPERTSLFEKFIHGELQFGLWGVLNRGIGLVNSLFVISALTLYQYGVFQLFLSAYAACTDFIAWGGLAAGTEILRAVGEKKEARAKRLFYEFNGLRIGTATLLWAFFFFGAPLISARYGPDFIRLIQIMSFMFIAEALLAAVKSLISLRLDFKRLASRSTIAKSFQLGILLGFFIFSTVGLKEVLLALVIGHLLSTAAFLPAAIEAWKPWREVRAEKGKLLLFRVARAHGKWDSMKNFLSQFVFRIQPWLIKIFVSTEAVAIYGVAGTLAELVMQVVPRNTMGVLVTRVFNDKERSKKVFSYTIKYFSLLGIMAALLAMVVVPVVIPIIWPQYAPAIVFFYLLVLLVPIKVLLWMTDIFLIVLRQQKFSFFRMLSRNIAGFILLLVLLPTIGLWGVAITEVLIRISFALIGYRQLIKLRPELRLTSKIFFSFTDDDRKILQDAWGNVRTFVRRKAA